MMELRLSGLDPADLESHQTSFLLEHLRHREEVRYAEVTLMVAASIHAGKIAGQQEPGDSLGSALRHYKNLVFPDIKNDLEGKARKKEDILKHEFERGPLKVQSLEYGTKKKKQKR